jgi:Fe-S-cluster containining protein
MGIIDSYMGICRAVELEFARNRSIYGDQIQCRAGCSDCCHQLFQITEIEAAWISHGIHSMDEAKRDRLTKRAEPYLQQRRRLVTTKGEPEAWGNLPPTGTRLACPALEDGVCQIYEFRPLICRKFGIPLYNPDKPGQVFACELNFRAGDAIDDGDLVQIQTGIHEDWKRVQGRYNAQGRHRDAKPITVARAILEDFRHCADLST